MRYMGGPRRQGGQGGPGRAPAGEGAFLPFDDVIIDVPSAEFVPSRCVFTRALEHARELE